MCYITRGCVIPRAVFLFHSLLFSPIAFQNLNIQVLLLFCFRLKNIPDEFLLRLCERARVHVCLRGRACVRACVRVLFLLYLWVVTNSQKWMFEYVW